MRLHRGRSVAFTLCQSGITLDAPAGPGLTSAGPNLRHSSELQRCAGSLRLQSGGNPDPKDPLGCATGVHCACVLVSTRLRRTARTAPSVNPASTQERRSKVTFALALLLNDTRNSISKSVESV